MADNFFKELFKYGFFAALFFAALIGVLELTGNTDWDRPPVHKERRQSYQNEAEFLAQFEQDIANLEKWPISDVFENLSEPETRLAAGVSELSAFATTLRRAMQMSKTSEQKHKVYRFAMMLIEKQRTFFIQERLFAEHRLNHDLADTGIRVHVPRIRNKTLEIRGPNLETAEKRDQIISQYKTDLNLARFGDVDWGQDTDGKPIEKTRFNGFEDHLFAIVRNGSPISIFDYSHFDN